MLKHRLLILLFASLLIMAFPAIGKAEDLPRKAFIEGVPERPQRQSLSCESRSAVDWAAFWGIKISEARFLRKLPRSDNPDKGFVGNPNDPLGNIPPSSYGVHAEPVAKLLVSFGFHAEAHKGMSWDELRAEIAGGRPVIVWVIGQMEPGTPVRYKPAHGKATTVARFEHTMILVGYTPKSVTVIDPAFGSRAVYSLKAFLTSWETLGRMAVTGYKPTVQDESEESSVSAVTKPPGRRTNWPDPFDELPISANTAHKLFLPLAARSQK